LGAARTVAAARQVNEVDEVVVHRGESTHPVTTILNLTYLPSVRQAVPADGLHSGTLAQGLANLYVKTANTAFPAKLNKLSPHDSLQNAAFEEGQHAVLNDADLRTGGQAARGTRRPR
jgi:hypothetical protein